MKLAADSRILSNGSGYFDVMLNNVDEFRSSSSAIIESYPTMKPLVLRIVASSNLMFQKAARLKKLESWLFSAFSDVSEAENMILAVEHLKIDLVRNVYLTEGGGQAQFFSNMGISESVNMLDNNHRLCLNRMIHVNQQLNVFWAEKREVIQRLQYLLRIEYKDFFLGFRAVWKDGEGANGVKKWLELGRDVNQGEQMRRNEESEDREAGEQEYGDVRQQGGLIRKLRGEDNDNGISSKQTQNNNNNNEIIYEDTFQTETSNQKVSKTTTGPSPSLTDNPSNNLTESQNSNQNLNSFKHLSEISNSKSQNKFDPQSLNPINQNSHRENFQTANFTKKPSPMLNNATDNPQTIQNEDLLDQVSSNNSLKAWKQRLDLKETEDPSFMQRVGQTNNLNMSNGQKNEWPEHPNVYKEDNEYRVSGQGQDKTHFDSDISNIKKNQHLGFSLGDSTREATQESKITNLCHNEDLEEKEIWQDQTQFQPQYQESMFEKDPRQNQLYKGPEDDLDIGKVETGHTSTLSSIQQGSLADWDTREIQIDSQFPISIHQQAQRQDSQNGNFAEDLSKQNVEFSENLGSRDSKNRGGFGESLEIQTREHFRKGDRIEYMTDEYMNQNNSDSYDRKRSGSSDKSESDREMGRGSKQKRSRSLEANGSQSIEIDQFAKEARAFDEQNGKQTIVNESGEQLVKGSEIGDIRHSGSSSNEYTENSDSDNQDQNYDYNYQNNDSQNQNYSDNDSDQNDAPKISKPLQTDLKNIHTQNGFIEIGDIDDDQSPNRFSEKTLKPQDPQHKFLENQNKAIQNFEGDFEEILEPEILESVNTHMMKSAERLYTESQNMLMNTKPERVPTRPFEEDSIEPIDWERKPSNKASDRWPNKETQPSQLSEPYVDPEINEIGSTNGQRNDQAWGRNKRGNLQQFGDLERNEKDLEDVKSEQQSDLMYSLNSQTKNSIYMDYRNEVLKNLEMSVSLESRQTKRENLTQHMSGLDDNTLDIERELEEIERNRGYANLKNPNFNNDIYRSINTSQNDSEIKTNSKIESLSYSKASQISNFTENYIQQPLKSTQSYLQARPICQETYEDKIYKSIEIELKKSLKFQQTDIAFINRDINGLNGSMTRSFNEKQYFKKEENPTLIKEDQSKTRQFGTPNLDEDEFSRSLDEREYRRNDSESDSQSDRNEKFIGSKEERRGFEDSSQESYFSSQDESTPMRSYVAMSENKISFQDHHTSLGRDSPRQEQKSEENDPDVNQQYLKKGESDLQENSQYLKTEGKDVQGNLQNQINDTYISNQYQINADHDQLVNPQDMEKSFKEQTHSLDQSKYQHNQNNENSMELESSLIESSEHAFPPAQHSSKPHRPSNSLKIENEEMRLLEDSQKSTSKGLFQSVVNIFGSISSSLGFKEKKQTQIKENEVFHSLKIEDGLATHEDPDFLKFEECGNVENNFDDHSKGSPNVNQVQITESIEKRMKLKSEYMRYLKEIKQTYFPNGLDQGYLKDDIILEAEEILKEEEIRQKEKENKIFSGDEEPDALGKFGDLD